MKAVKPECTNINLKQNICMNLWSMEQRVCLSFYRGGGENACILHYSKNTDLLKDGDLVWSMQAANTGLRERYH